jgi:hypothetical protein
MIKKLLFISSVVTFAFAILSISILQTTSISYSFTAKTLDSPVLGIDSQEIDYQMPYEGKVLPDSPLWVLKAARDRVWFLITSSHSRKAELALLFSDKRLMSVSTLLEKNKPDIAISTLTKGEKYLEVAVSEEKMARQENNDTSIFLTRLAMASLKHWQIIESLMPLVPEDAKPFVSKTENYSKNSYRAARDVLNSKGLPVPIGPFTWD